MNTQKHFSALAVAALLVTGTACADDATEPEVASAIVIVSGNEQSAAVGSALAQPLVVEVRDQFGNVLSNATVSWVVTAGAGTLSSASTQTDTSGRTQVNWTLGTVAGSQTVTATTSTAITVTFTTTATES